MGGFAQAYLRHPDLFPARLSGEPWDDQEVAFELAGERHVVAGLAAPEQQDLSRRYAVVAHGGGGPGLETLVYRADPRDFRDRDPRAAVSFDLDYRADGVRLAGHGFVARLDWRPGLRGAIWTSARGRAFRGVFENYLRVLLAHRLLERGGALVHSAGVRDGSRGYLLCGRSGAGKSTFSGLVRAAGGALLSDELNALCLRGGKPFLGGLPFVGDHEPDPASDLVPLQAIGRLRQSASPSLEPLTRAECLASLVACCPFVNRDPHRLERLLHNLETVLACVPAYELGFTRTGSGWDLLRRAGRA